MRCFHVKGSGPGSGADADSDSNEAGPCPSEQGRKPRPRLILHPSHKQFGTSRVPPSLSSLLLSPQRASASYCLLGFSSAEQLRRRIVAFPFLFSGSVLPTRTPTSHSSLVHSITSYPQKKKKTQKNHNLYSDPHLRCGVVRGGGAGYVKVTV